jgi:cysteine desulfurase/selenocysteine lyase
MSTSACGAEKGPVPRFDLEAVRARFPILARRVHGKPLAYLDNAATSQKPRDVIERMRVYYEAENANVHRGVHRLSQEATDAYERARERCVRFLNAPCRETVIFTRGTTEAINLVARSFGRSRVGPGDEILLTGLEHHSNIVPWQLLAEEQGATIRILPIDREGRLRIGLLDGLLTPRTRIVAVSHVSNALGTVNPIARVIAAAHARGVPVLVDGAQAVPHLRVDVSALDADFYAFSGHKVLGPTGIGVLYGRRELLEAMPPWQGGGDMIASVTFEKTTYNVLPYRFEAGTPPIAEAIGLAAALDVLEEVGIDVIAEWESVLVEKASSALSAIPGVTLVGTAPERASVVSFVVEGIHAHDVGTILDHEGVAIRAGHHCAQPVMDFFGVPATVRASFAFYNTLEEVDRLVAAVRRAQEIFA